MRRMLMPLVLAAMWSSPLPVQAQPATPFLELSLDGAVERAVSRSPVLLAAQRDADAAEAALQQAGARANPTLNAAVEDTRRASRSTTATLEWPIELGGKRAARIAVAERSRELAQAVSADTRSRLRAEVAREFFGVLVAQERLALSADSVRLAAAAADAAARRVAAGKVAPIDEARARVDEANAQLEAAEADVALAQARRSLATLWGDAEPDFARVQGDTDALPSRPPFGELLAGLDASPGLQAHRLELDRQRALVDLARSRAVPDLGVSVGAKRDNELGRTLAIVGVSLPLPLFDRQQGGVLEAARRADKAEAEQQQARLQALAALQQACGQLALATTTVRRLKDTVLPAARQAHDAATRGFEAGKFGFLDVLDAQRSLLQARERHLSALSSAHQAAAAIDRLLGR
ncbi:MULTISPECIES: TolC family protein [unclassified Rhizobacter]|uniref:TolC family protein n=1 Tax=unclassified Rhizobacter TaxID=2640088 RepID=UPI0006FA8DE7|nr:MULTISPECIES: TolC family protein [unclassified Rhizobacter]KQU81550.1 cobalt-zinc-cadmium resistance protein [Rhizobacter sp. Root29]KQW12119.1 cobalt-zinc-cadmium resistance protein [Rhizobacter sp. Root1238]KRB02934.1 cobalt-zinc-cadmium resistance protein [Rhizobacter sp. Root16D2]